MDPNHFANIERLFAEALDQSDADRASWMRALQESEPDLAREVARLLEHHAEDDEGWPDLAQAILDGVSRAEWTGSSGAGSTPASLGPYRILDELGRGGMGRVFLAERPDIGKRVALKVVRGPFISDDQVRRFEREQRILARLEHPGIAQLHDAGVAEEGAPYFAMEVVHGRPITRFCWEDNLGLEDRLALFLELCSTVAYAHRNLVVHRDIKPGNVLVTEDRRVKLLDFGVAKLLDVGNEREATRAGTRIFTPSYASPEQLRGERVTTATDIYQLGVLLYELLCGVAPFDVSTLTPADAARVVGEEVPPPPSSRKERGLGSDTLGDPTSPTRTLRRVRGDLDRIVLKCLEKAPSRRYGTADALSDDIRRFLDGRPVLARPGGPVYRARKFVRRHRTLTTAALLAVGYALTITGQNRIVTRERDRAAEAAEEASVQARRAERVTDFVVGLLSSADPYREPDPSASVQELLARGVSEADALGGQPAVRAAVLEAIGTTQYNLGLHDEAELALRGAVDLYDSIGPTEEGAELRDVAVQRLAENHLAREEYAQAVELFRALLRRRASSPPDALYQRGLSGLGNALHLLGDAEGADSAWSAWESLLETDRVADPELLRSLGRLGVIRRYQGDLEGAERLLHDAAGMSTELLGAEHPATGESLQDLANLMIQLGDTVGADTTTLRATRIARATFSETSTEVAFAMQQRATALEWRGEVEQAESLLREAVEIEYSLPDNGLNWATRAAALGEFLHRRGEFAEARAVLEQGTEWFATNFGPDALMTVLREGALARVMIDSGDYDGAEAILRSGHSRLLATRGEDDPYAAQLAASLVSLYEAWGRPESAAAYR
ncbi:MAG: protein kinase [Gemmatimonadota bacterium]|nr:protein kinase [Gemmatimonadota bacterium]